MRVTGMYENDLWFPSNTNWFKARLDKRLASKSMSSSALMESPRASSLSDIMFGGFSYVLSFVPWATETGNNFVIPSTVNASLKRHARSGDNVESVTQYANIRFRPYVSKVPWHTGPRAFLSQLFPRYGHYCGPNWSSGKDGGSLLWDRRPIDWLDFCCYCHDIGYDSHDQADLLKADLAFLECLEKPYMKTKGDARAAHIYRTMCISGLRNILIPYRQYLVNLQLRQFSFGLRWPSNLKLKGWNLQKT